MGVVLLGYRSLATWRGTPRPYLVSGKHDATGRSRVSAMFEKLGMAENEL
jgi:hypothetical protein